MQTPSVQNQANVAPSPTPGAKQQNSTDVSFNQMLTQQIADRGNVIDVGNSSTNASKVNDTSKANDPDKSADASQSAQSTAPSNDGKPAAPAPAGSADAKPADKDKPNEGEAQANATSGVPAATELIAMITKQMNHANGKSDDSNQATAKVDLRASLTQDRTANLTKDALSKAIDGKETAADKSKAGFAATMAAIEQSGNTEQSVQLATSKLHEGLSIPSANANTPLQQIALHLEQTATTHADKLTPQVGTPAWDQALGQKVVWMVTGTQQSASLTLNPPDLGPMQVVLNVSNGHADASFTAAQPEVRQALEAALPKLREMMSEAGIQLGQATVSAGMPDQQNNSGERNGSSSRGNGETGDGTETTTRVIGTTKITGGQGLVDTFV
jgi:flagellar hook-length control protein FliK